MLSRLLLAWCLMAVCVMCHAAGTTSALRRLRPLHTATFAFWGWTWVFIRLAGWITLIHLVQIAIWALFYVWQGALPNVADALYFSAVTYTTTGYGDVVLTREWRLVGAVEALTGILMCGWSTGFFFAAVSRMFEMDRKRHGGAAAGAADRAQ